MTTLNQPSLTAEPGPASPRAEEQDHSLAAARNRARQAWQQLFLQIGSFKPNDVVQLLLAVGALVGVGWLIWSLWSTLTPFIMGAVVAYLMSPVVNRLTRRMPRWAAVLLVVGVSLLLLVVALAFLVPVLAAQLNALLQALPDTAQIEAWISQLDAFLRTLPGAMQSAIDEGIRQAIATLRANSIEYIRQTVRFVLRTILNIAGSFTGLIGYVVVPFWLFFVLLDMERGKKGLNRLLPAWLQADFWAVLQLCHRVIGSYFRGQLILGTIVASAVYLGLTLLQLAGVEGIRFKLLLAVFAGFMELVPIIGPILGAVPAIIIALLHSWQSALAVGLLFLVIQQLEGNILVPRIVGKSISIHPAIVMVLVVMLSPFGLAWMIVALPLTAIIRDLYIYIYGRFGNPPRPAGLLPGSEPATGDSSDPAITVEEPRDPEVQPQF